MRSRLTAILIGMILLPMTFVHAAEKEEQGKGKIVVNTKELVEIHRQVRLMRAEMAELEEKIAQMTALRDNVYKMDTTAEPEKKEEQPKEECR